MSPLKFLRCALQKTGLEEGSILCRKYLCREEGRRIKCIQRYSWKEKGLQWSRGRRDVRTPSWPTNTTWKQQIQLSSQTPALTSAIYHHLPHSQHMEWLLTEGIPHSKAQTWAHWLMRSRGESSPSASHAANCGELTKHPHRDHTAPLTVTAPLFLCSLLGPIPVLSRLMFSLRWEKLRRERKEEEKYAFQLPNHLPQNAPCISTDFIICLLLQILFKE